MDTLKKRRAQYLKVLESVGGNPQVLEIIEVIEHDSKSLSKEKCAQAVARQYIRTGVLDSRISGCTTYYKSAHCAKKDLPNVEAHFNRRNPQMTAVCSPPEEYERFGHCYAYLKVESLSFDAEKN